MTGESTNSKETENIEDIDSATDSGEADSDNDTTQDTDDAPVVIEGEAEEVDAEETSDVAEEEIAAQDKTDETSEDVVSEEPEPLPAVTPPAAQEKRGSALPLIGGGLIAGAIGFLAANLGLMQNAPDTSTVDARLDELSASIADMEPADTTPLVERLESLSTDVQALLDAPAPSGDLPTSVIERIESLEVDVSSGIEVLTDRIAALEDRLADVQISQDAGPGQAEEMTNEELANFQSELQQLTEDAKAQVEEAKARASEIEAAAAEAAAAAQRKAALASLTAAVESGDSFANELGALESPPKALTSVAEDGIATMGTLQRAFPDAARAALATSTQVPQDASATERLTAFLKRQTNARSLAPREGDDVDAILSRAEASLLNGDLGAAVSELAALPEEAGAAMEPWMAQANSRLDALSAISELTADN